MQHEALLALAGYPGDVCCRSVDGKFTMVDSYLQFLHPTERHMLDRVCRVGTIFSRVSRFVLSKNLPLFDQKALQEERSMWASLGVYADAISKGLSLALQPYSDWLIECERDLIEDGRHTLVHVVHGAERFSALLLSLDDLTHDILTNHRTIRDMLSLVNKRTMLCSDPAVRPGLDEIFCQCYGVLLKYICAWVLHGVIINEDMFFVQSNLVNRESSSLPLTNSDLLMEWRNGYQIKQDSVPELITPEVAEKILLIGKAVKISREWQGRGEAAAATMLNSEAMTHYAGEFTKLAQGLSNCDVATVVSSLPILIHNLWTAVSSTQRQYFMDPKQNGMGMFHNFRDYYLLGKGCVFQELLRTCGDQFLVRASPAMTRLNRTFHDIAEQYGEDASAFTVTHNHEDLKFTEDNAADEVSDLEAMGRVSMSFECEYVHGMVINAGIMADYNKIFSFLLQTRYVQVQLHAAWKQQSWLSKADQETKNLFKPIVHCHRTMCFFMDNLQYYLQLDVVTSRFAMLEKSIQSSVTLEHIMDAHAHFLSRITSECFVAAKPIVRVLREVYRLCIKFVRLYASMEKRDMAAFGEADAFSKSFDRQVAFLLQLLSSMATRQSGAHLTELLVRLDFNRFYANK